MAVKNLVKQCPSCGKVYEQRAYASWGRRPKESDKWVFGSPMRVCPHCGKVFIDTDVRELAVTPLRPQDKALITMGSLKLGLLGLVLGAVLMIGRQAVLGWIALGVALATLAADLALCPTRRRKLERERLASQARLADPDYARALKRAGFDIPERYLNPNMKEEEPA